MLVEYALAQLAARGATIQLVDLAALPAEPLLGRGATATVAEAIEAATRAGIIVAGAPGYRAAYSGVLKGVFDPLPPDSPIGEIRVPLVTRHTPPQAPSRDHRAPPLVAR